tara:strand:- start:14742 stop:16061 length:1320 start_codon:yes stop_codon:yes gene_type:complete
MDIKGDICMKKVIVRGPALTRSGYGEHVRAVLRSLRKIEDKVDIYLIPVGWGATGWIVEKDEEREWFDAIVKKTSAAIQQKQQFDVSIQVSIPNEWEQLAPINVGVTAGIETTKVAPQWLEKGNMMDLIIVPSQHSKQVYQKTSYEATNSATNEIVPDYKCTTPIEVISYPVKEFTDLDLGLELQTDFNFINVAQWSPRKDLKSCIEWFVEEFIDQEVGLILKTNRAKNCLMDKFACEKMIEQVLNRKRYKNKKCKIYLLHGDMTDQEMHQLYRHPKIKAFMTTSHGEGFGLPMFEAAYEGLPVVAPDWSGYLDFLYMPVVDKKGKTKSKAKFAKVEYSMRPISKNVVWDGVLQEGSMWAYSDQGSFKMRLREIYKDYGRFKKQATELQKWVRVTLSEENINSQYVEALETVCNLDSDQEIEDLFNELVSYDHGVVAGT